MDKHIELKITSPATEVNVSSVDAEEVARIVQLAGIQRPPSTSATLSSVADRSSPNLNVPAMPDVGMLPSSDMDMPHHDDMDMSHHDDIGMPPSSDMDMPSLNSLGVSPPHASMEEPHDHNEMPMDLDMDDDPIDLGEQQAEFDFGNNPEEADGEDISPNDYLYQGPKEPQRIVRSLGDNPLLQEIQLNLWSKYAKFLQEQEDRENDDGVMSPLSDPTKPEFDKDPLSGVTPVDDGSHSPMSTVVRQPFNK